MAVSEARRMEGYVLVDFKRMQYRCDYCGEVEDCEANIYRRIDNPQETQTIILHRCPVIGRGSPLEVRRWRVVMDKLGEIVNDLTGDL